MRFLGILAALTALIGCDVISTDISVHYPFDKDKPEEYSISIDQAMNNLNTAINQQTDTLVTLKADTSAFPAGSEISVDTTLSLDNMLKLIAGEMVTITTTVIATFNGNTQTEQQHLTFSICDFVKYKTQGVTTEFEFADVHMEIRALDTYCVDTDKDGVFDPFDPSLSAAEKDAWQQKRPYLYITHRTTPKAIQLSNNKKLAKYKSLLNKIRSATLDELRLTISEKPEGLSFSENADPEDTSFTMSASFFVQPVKDCTGAADNLVCTGTDFSEDRNPADFYADTVDPETGINPYWVGTFGNDEVAEGDTLKLIYTYDGNNILQKAIKNLDFQIGIKSWYKIKPGSQRPGGTFKASVEATFFFSVEPLR